jgi:cell division transport system permease protein
MIRHAVAEGLVILRERAAVSLVLAFSLAVPVALAGVGVALHQWLDPIAGMAGEKSSVAVLLHPQMESGERRRWIADRASENPEWKISEVSNSDVIGRLQRWFPYLEDLIDTGDSTLPPLIEIQTDDPDSVAVLDGREEVLAVGPRSSIQQTLGQVAGRLATVVGVLSGVLLASALLLAAVWVHLELYRHADEIAIMRLVGATEGTIRGPFLVAVVIPGTVAGLLAIVGSMMLVASFSRLTSSLGLSEVTISTAVLVLQGAVCVLLPLIAAGVTLARHSRGAAES